MLSLSIFYEEKVIQNLKFVRTFWMLLNEQWTQILLWSYRYWYVCWYAEKWFKGAFVYWQKCCCCLLGSIVSCMVRDTLKLTKVMQIQNASRVRLCKFDYYFTSHSSSSSYSCIRFAWLEVSSAHHLTCHYVFSSGVARRGIGACPPSIMDEKFLQIIVKPEQC